MAGSTMDTRILRTLRTQAWARAKGELAAVLETYWDCHTEGDESFNEIDKAIKVFIKNVEDNGWQE